MEDASEIKIKRSGLEKAKDILSIIRDLLLIIVFIVLLVVGLSFINMIQSASSLFSCAMMPPGGGMIPKAPISSGLEPKTASKSSPSNSDLCDLLIGVRDDYFAGDSSSALSKLNQAESLAKSRGLTETAKDISEIEKASSSGDITRIISLSSKISSDLGC